MGQTTREYKGKTHREKADGRTKNYKPGAKKHFGDTSGNGSNALFNYVEDAKTGNTVRQRKGKDADADRPRVKGEDYVKYGWPFETRPKKVVNNLAKEKESEKEVEQQLGKRPATDKKLKNKKKSYPSFKAKIKS